MHSSVQRVLGVLWRVLVQGCRRRLGVRNRHAIQLAHVLDVAQPAEQPHHGLLAWRVKRFPGQILGIGQCFAHSVFGALVHFSHLVLVSPFCRRAALCAIVVFRYVLAPLTARVHHKDSISLLSQLNNWLFGLRLEVSQLTDAMGELYLSGQE